MQVSANGIEFIAKHEGFVDHPYKDAVGVLTIGHGFTMRSLIFARYWKGSRGHALQSGDKLPRAESKSILRMLLDDEYAKDIDKLCKPTNQHQFDACASVSYNAGPGSLDDAWARALALGEPTTAARLLRGYKLTHGLLKGRREDEAQLLQFGDYGIVARPDATAYQTQLAKLGLYTGEIDGIAGHATKAAVMEFQKTHGLDVDGVVGPLTQSALDKATPKGTPDVPNVIDTPLSPPVLKQFWLVTLLKLIFLGHR